MSEFHKNVLNYKRYQIVETPCYPCKYTFIFPSGHRDNSFYAETIDRVKQHIDKILRHSTDPLDVEIREEYQLKDIEQKISKGNEILMLLYKLMDPSDDNIPDIDCHLDNATRELNSYIAILQKNKPQ